MDTDPLLLRLQALDWPTPTDDRPDPAVGELWLLTWNGIRTFGLITDIDRRTLEVAVASTPDAGDETTVDVQLPDAGMKFAVWQSIRRTVRRFVLDHRLGALDPDVAHSLDDQPRQWGRITSVLDDRSLIRAELTDELDELAEAEWVPKADGPVVSLADRAQELGLTIADIRTRLDIAPGAASRLLQRQAAATPDQATLLADLLRLSVDEVQGHLEVDERLVDQMDRPKVRPVFQLIAGERFAGDERAARVNGASRTTALAARHQEQGDTDWETLLSDALHDG